MVFVPILLLNMLIAMMGNTYAHVTEQSEKEWVKQWAKIVISLERAIPQKEAHNYLQVISFCNCANFLVYNVIFIGVQYFPGSCRRSGDRTKRSDGDKVEKQNESQTEKGRCF